MSIRDTLKQIEQEKTLAEAGGAGGVIEKGLEKLGYGIGKFKSYAGRAKQAVTGGAEKVAPGAEKVAPGAEKVAPAPGGYVPAKPDAAAVSGLNAEQKQLSDYFANPKNHVTKDGKVWGRDPKNVGEFIELDAKTFLPKGQIGVNRAQYYAPGHLNRELEALEKLGPKELEAAQSKALASEKLSAAEKAEIKSGGLLAWVRKNPGKAGLIAAIVGVVAVSQLGGEEEADVSGLPDNVGPGNQPAAPVQSEPVQGTDTLMSEIITLMQELEKQPECAKEVEALRAELGSDAWTNEIDWEKVKKNFAPGQMPAIRESSELDTIVRLAKG